MNKGCLFAAGSAIAVLLLCCGAAMWFGPKYLGPIVLAQMEADIAQYRKLHPQAIVEPTNEAWAQALSAPDSGVKLQPQWAQLVEQGKGKLIDIYQNPVRLETEADGTIRVLSNGKDGIPNTEDDDTSELVRDMLPAQ